MKKLLLSLIAALIGTLAGCGGGDADMASPVLSVKKGYPAYLAVARAAPEATQVFADIVVEAKDLSGAPMELASTGTGIPAGMVTAAEESGRDVPVSIVWFSDSTHTAVTVRVPVEWEKSYKVFFSLFTKDGEQITATAAIKEDVPPPRQ